MIIEILAVLGALALLIVWLAIAFSVFMVYSFKKAGAWLKDWPERHRGRPPRGLAPRPAPAVLEADPEGDAAAIEATTACRYFMSCNAWPNHCKACSLAAMRKEAAADGEASPAVLEASRPAALAVPKAIE